MSRETLLDEAIAKAKECEDWQLVEWLRMARGGESAARWYTGKLAELQAENDKMVMKLNAEHIVRQNVERENAKLRDELDFCLKYVPKCDECAAMLDCDECLRADSSQKERKRLDYENAKLRELVEDMAAEIRGLGVDFKRVGWCDYADRMCELGVEVDK